MTSALTNSVSQRIALFGFSDINLFEIDDTGMILYCRTENIYCSDSSAPILVGCNFFDETFLFENMEELRRKFKHFINSDLPTETFRFIFKSEDLAINAKIKMVRIVERVDGGRSASTTIIDIRKCN